jgi:DNA-binding GntR family transcriptional regulator
VNAGADLWFTVCGAQRLEEIGIHFVKMADPNEIQGWRQAHKAFSREQLLQVLHEKVSSSAEHIAARQALDERDQSFQRKLYRISHCTLCWTIVAVIAALIAALAAV